MCTPAEIFDHDIFKNIQMICFLEIYSSIFQVFKKSSEYQNYISSYANANSVSVDDFVYYDKLGEGGFGTVIKCKKKTTGRFYAMKIQKKKDLLSAFQDDQSRVDYEVKAFVKSNHPYIINLDYSFQTPTLAIMILGLADAGDLQDAISNSPNKRLNEDRAKFYAAEIALALHHMHNLGLLYRDLKPSNVLLGQDGHCFLSDLGGVIDESGQALDNCSPSPFKLNAENSMKCSDQDNTPPSLSDSKALSAPPQNHRVKRRFSVMGTYGFMAPEMVALLSRPINKNYSFSVDWFSFGVTLYKLLTGKMPFEEDLFDQFVELKRHEENEKDYLDEKLFGDIDLPNYLSLHAADIIKQLLHVDEKKRLGSTEGGFNKIIQHPFFKDIDFDLLLTRHVTPPYVPANPSESVADDYVSDFSNAMCKLGKKSLLSLPPLTQEENKHFQHFDYINPNVLKTEFGIANEFAQYNRCAKVKRLLGSAEPHHDGDATSFLALASTEIQRLPSTAGSTSTSTSAQ